MALILAIEPDRRQAGQLTAMVKGRLHAEFVIGESAEAALAALGSRVPDLVLTTALLSPKDETALSERLRALDGAAAHVQTLTIPVLATTSRRRIGGKGGGVLSALLGDKSKTDDAVTAEGCDPAMFAEQCKEYLERAAADRASTLEGQHRLAAEEIQPLPAPIFDAAPAAAEAPYEYDAQAESTDTDDVAQPEALDAAPEPFTTPEIVAPQPAEHRSFRARMNDDEPPAALLAAVAAFADDDEPVADATDAVEPARYLADVIEPVSYRTDADEPLSYASNAEQSVIDATAPDAASANDAVAEQSVAGSDLADVDLSSFFDDTLGRKAAAAVDEEPSIPVYEIDAAAFDHHNGTEALFADATDGDDAGQTAHEDAVYPPAVKQEVRTWPILDDIAAGTDFNSLDAAAPTAQTAPSAAGVSRTEADELREWSDIIEALRRDAHPAITPATASAASFAPDPLVSDSVALEPADAEPVIVAEAAAAESVVDEPVAQEPVLETIAPEPAVPDPAAVDPEPVAPRRKGRRKASVQDEWGFFDPDRAGFAALLAKLEEITEDDAAKPHRT